MQKRVFATLIFLGVAIVVGLGNSAEAQNAALPGNESPWQFDRQELAPSGAAGQIDTGYINDLGWCSGPYWNLTAAPGAAVRVDSFEMYFQGTVNRDVEVYYRAGSYIGSETTPGDWTLAGTVNVTPSGTGTANPIAIGGMTIPAGETYGFKVWDGGTGTSDGPGLDMRSGGSVASNADLSLSSDHYNCDNRWEEVSSTFGWQGSVLYSIASLPAQELNIDLGSTHGTPSSAPYGAEARQAGHWNTVGLGVTSGLLDTLAAATPVNITVTADTDTGGHTGSCSVQDSKALMGDNIFTFNGLWSVTLTGLENGLYKLFLYAPTHTSVAIGNLIVNGVSYSSILGSTVCDSTPGVGSVAVLVEVVNGTLSLTGNSAGTGRSYAGLAGLQLHGPVTLFADGFESGDVSQW